MHQPLRSISLPSRIYPLSFKLETSLNHLSIWRKSSSSISISISFESKTLLVGLMNLLELYGCVQELLKSPYVTQTLAHKQKEKLLEDCLDGSVMLLEVCEAAKEMIVAMREQIEDLNSAIRRKGNVEKEVKDFVYLRKKLKKEIAKYITFLKKMEIRDHEPVREEATSVLREIIGINVSIFRHFLLFLSRMVSMGRKFKNGLGFLTFSYGKSMDLIKEMKRFDDGFVGFCEIETGLDSVFKCLVKNRVLFLNILSNC